MIFTSHIEETWRQRGGTGSSKKKERWNGNNTICLYWCMHNKFAVIACNHFTPMAVTPLYSTCNDQGMVVFATWWNIESSNIHFVYSLGRHIPFLTPSPKYVSLVSYRNIVQMFPIIYTTTFTVAIISLCNHSGMVLSCVTKFTHGECWDLSCHRKTTIHSQLHDDAVLTYLFIFCLIFFYSFIPVLMN